MSEDNWALSVNGASVAEVSHEAALQSSPASHLLSEREDLLWITGDAPQHVTIALSPAHPPLRYAGWHVWHDYVTNPKRVEVASGETLHSLAPLLVCQALPGAGTQVWRLPSAIPQQHRYVRFTIVETFGPGPTYLNSIALLANDPGPAYCAGAPATAESASPSPVFDRRPSGSEAPTPAQLRAPPAMRSYRAPTGTVTTPADSVHTPRGPGDVGAYMRQSTTASGAPISPRPSSARYAPSGTTQDGASVGVFSRSAPMSTTNNHHHQHQHNTPGGGHMLATPTSSSLPHQGLQNGAGGGGSNSGRMNQLLRDLDEDIRNLRPIKSVSPKKNMLVYVSHDPPQILPPHEDTDDSPERYSHGGDDDDNDRAAGDRRNGRNDGPRGRSSRSANYRESRSGGSSSRPRQSGSRGVARDAPPPPPPPPPQQAPVVAPPVAAAAAPVAAPPAPLEPAPVIAYYPSASPAVASVFDRLGALEQAVATLTQTVQHQRDDITMLKRLLLQQTTERRKEAERQEQQHLQSEEEWRRRLEREREGRLASEAKARGLVAVAPAAPVARSTSADLRLTRHHVDIDFPEEALRSFVATVLDEKLHRQLKKTESKMLNRLDAYLHDVVTSIAEGVDERVQWHLSRATEPSPAHHHRRAAASGAYAAAAAAAAPPPVSYPVPPISIDQTALSANSPGGSGASAPPSQQHLHPQQPPQQYYTPPQAQYAPAAAAAAAPPQPGGPSAHAYHAH